MAEHARRPRFRRRGLPGPEAIADADHRLGEEALHFAKWFGQSKYRLMGRFLNELQRPDDPTVLRARYGRALEHAERVHRARGVVTFLLAFGVLATAASAIGNMLGAPERLADDVSAATQLMERLAAIFASVSVLLIAVRLLLDRYLERVDVAATFIGMQIAAGR